MASTVTLGPRFRLAVQQRALLQKELAFKASVSVNSVSAAMAGRPVRVDVARRLALAIMRVDLVAGLTEWIEPEDG